MNPHLSSDQITRCIAGSALVEERRHLEVCEECRAEIDRFEMTMASFRTALRDHVEIGPRTAPVSAGVWRWTFAVASLAVFVIVPFIARDKVFPSAASRTSAEEADALMRSVNAHLSRTLAAPMEPILALFPESEDSNQSGGIQ